LHWLPWLLASQKVKLHQKKYFARTGIPEQILDRICIAYYDYIDTLEVQLGDNGKLSRGTEAEITQAVLDAAKYAPAHFKMW
jgi:hypothetical protein